MYMCMYVGMYVCINMCDYVCMYVCIFKILLQSLSVIILFIDPKFEFLAKYFSFTIVTLSHYQNIKNTF